MTMPARRRFPSGSRGGKGEETIEFAASLGALFPTTPLEDRARKASLVGYRSIESWWPWSTGNPSPAEQNAFIDSVVQAEVDLRLLNLWGGPSRFGASGIMSHPHLNESFEVSTRIALDVAAKLRVSTIHALVGQVPPGLSRAEAMDVAIPRLARLAAEAAAIDATVVVEYLNGLDHPRYLIDSPARAIEIAERVSTKAEGANVGFLLDTYHLTRGGENIAEVLATVGDRLWHVQIADGPGRIPPGSGNYNVRGDLKLIEKFGYRGTVGAEFAPTSTGTVPGPRELQAALRALPS